MKYDYLIVGSGLFGAVFAHEAEKNGKRCLIIEKNNHIGGHIYTEKIEGINVHKYGAHIFHTSNKKVWDYIRQFSDFNHFINSPIANYRGEIYNLPFNMNTFSKMWGVKTPKEAEEIIIQQRSEIRGTPKNLEEQAIQLVGRDIYEKLIKGYTEKQWGRPCRDLPSFIIKRLPVRFTYDNNYFNDTYQGIPIGGYTEIIEKMIQNIDLELNTDFNLDRESLKKIAKKIVYTGTIDSYFDYYYGHLKYRSLNFENEIFDIENYQGVAVVNYTDFETPFTRILEHKHFEFGKQSKTVITREYSVEWKPGDEPYYPINDAENQTKYQQYEKLANRESDTLFGGRLAKYKYYDMHEVIYASLCAVENEFKL